MLSGWAAAAAGLVAGCTNFVDGDVFDGPPVTADDLRAALMIGWSPGSGDTVDAGQITTLAHDAGLPGAREESGDIRCVIICQSGDDDISLVRAQAFAMLDQVTRLCQRMPQAGNDSGVAQAAGRFLGVWTGGTSSQLLNVAVTSAQISQGRSPSGVYCEITFTVSFEALNT